MITTSNDIWSYLDVMDKNLLYQYADVMSGRRQRMAAMNSQTDKYTVDYAAMENKKKNAYYLIWFVYRYLLGCKTYEETVPYQTEEVLRKYHLYSFIKKNHIYIDVDAELVFYRSSDIAMILEILYNRYSVIEQLECFAKHTKNHRKHKCEETLKQYKELAAMLAENAPEGAVS